MFRSKNRYVIWFCVFCLFLVSPAWAKKTVYVPEALKPWTKWVLEGMPLWIALFLGDGTPAPRQVGKNTAAVQRVCAWGSALNLTATYKGARFDQQWTLYDDATLVLPGEKRHWPIAVRAGGKPAPVTERNGVPTLTLKKGSYKIEGRFEWSRLPQWLELGSSTGIVRLSDRRQKNRISAIQQRPHRTGTQGKQGRAIRTGAHPDKSVPQNLRRRAAYH